MLLGAAAGRPRELPDLNGLPPDLHARRRSPRGGLGQRAEN